MVNDLRDTRGGGEFRAVGEGGLQEFLQFGV